MRGIDEVGGAELSGHGFFAGKQVDGDDLGRPRQHAGLDDVEADAAHAEHGDALAVGDLGPVEHGTDPGHHRTADEGGGFERDVVGDLHRLALEHDRALDEGRHVGEREGLFSVDRERLAQLADALGAHRGMARLARRTQPAVRERREDDVVTRLEGRDLVADLLDDAGCFVAEHDRRREGNGAIDHAEVAVTQAGGADPHGDLVGPRVANLDVVAELDLAVEEHPPHTPDTI